MYSSVNGVRLIQINDPLLGIAAVSLGWISLFNDIPTFGLYLVPKPALKNNSSDTIVFISTWPKLSDEVKLSYFETAIQHFNHYASKTIPVPYGEKFSKNLEINLSTCSFYDDVVFLTWKINATIIQVGVCIVHTKVLNQ